MVLDTNAVLDWLVFADPGMSAVASAMQGGELLWLASPSMRAELADTLRYRSLAKWLPDSERALDTFDRYAQVRPEPPPSPLQLRCSDPDDQVFLDLALAWRAKWLLTHDRALLRLAKRARAFGLQVMPPRGWAEAHTAAPAPHEKKGGPGPPFS